MLSCRPAGALQGLQCCAALANSLRTRSGCRADHALLRRTATRITCELQAGWQPALRGDVAGVGAGRVWGFRPVCGDVNAEGLIYSCIKGEAMSALLMLQRSL